MKKILILFAYFKKKCYLCSVINEGLQRENLDALDKKRRTKKPEVMKVAISIRIWIIKMRFEISI